MTSWYRTGTVTVTNGSQTVTGTGTLFASNVRVGDMFLGPDGKSYEVQNVASDTVIGIFPGYAGATASGQIYGIVPVQGYVKASADRLRQAVDDYSDKLEGLQPWAYANSAADARDDLELGDMSIQEPNSVAITGGTISGISSIGVAGDIAVSGDARRIRGDFSNSTIANRTALQSSVTNGASNVHVLPNGTSQSAMIAVNNNSAPNNSAYAGLSISSTEARIQSGVSGSGSALPLSIWTGSAEAAKVSAVGNFGFGVASPDTSARIQSANGIKLGNTANSSPVVLDWYEEGSTPTVTARGQTTTGSATYTNQIFDWVRRGNRVDYQITLSWSGHTGTGPLLIGPLPFAAAASGFSTPKILMEGSSIPRGSNKILEFYIQPGTTVIGCELVDTSTEVVTAYSVPTNVANLIITGSYRV